MIVYVINFFLYGDINFSLFERKVTKEANKLRQLERLYRLVAFSGDKSVKT